MKNHILKLLAGCVIISVVFSSCSKISNNFIAKRHYRDGYYMSLSGKQAENGQQTQARVKKNKASVIPKAGPVQVQPAITNEQTASAGTIVEKENPIRKTKHVKRNRRNLAEIRNIVKKPVNLFPSDPKEFKKAVAVDRGDDALSLIWILIVIILIVYLVGLLLGGLGLGNLIHLLLVVAVILLILWLLRII